MADLAFFHISYWTKVHIDSVLHGVYLIVQIFLISKGQVIINLLISHVGLHFINLKKALQPGRVLAGNGQFFNLPAITVYVAVVF